MSEQRRDRLVGLIVLAFAVAWTLIAYMTIRPGHGGSLIGPRHFPIGLGVLLAFLSLLLVVSSFLRDGDRDPQDPVSDGVPISVELWAVGWTAGSLVAYALLMGWFGFIPATVVVIAVILRIALNVRSPIMLLGMPLGLGFGVYFIMGRLMGVYLPRGTVFQLF